ncbi:hypothetical protein [Nocardiopsis potens]|uniref:hypothetical protein n=1 Tax=Nocardiopsis potens TaxID=1246458 RepID=UPI00034B22D3|nr:hypothetical protein [Nocardiopsis potens]
MGQEGGEGGEPVRAVPPSRSRRAVLRFPTLFLVLGVLLSLGAALVGGAAVAAVCLLLLDPGEAAGLGWRFWASLGAAAGAAFAVCLWISHAFDEDGHDPTWQDTVVLRTLAFGTGAAVFGLFLVELFFPLLPLIGPHF